MVFNPTGESTSQSAPIGGLNTRDAVDLMPQTDAIRLDNFFPGSTDVSLRKGYINHVTGLPSTVQSLLTYQSPSANKLFAASSGEIYDVTSAGAIGASWDTASWDTSSWASASNSPVLTGLSNAKWESVNFTTSGGSFLFIVNGADAPRHYNGSAWATPTLSGVTGSTINNVTVFKERLFFIINDSLSFGYLPINAVAGTVSTFPLGSVFNFGGKLVAAGSLTRDGGSGSDDYIAFITSEGEVAVYQGTDPSDANKWALVGVFKIARPIGKRCIVNVGPELIVITESGFVPLTQMYAENESNYSKAISDKISGSIITAVTNFKSTFGWEALIYPKGQFGLFNIPNGVSGEFVQFVVNLSTGAWGRFTGQDAYCWGLLNGDLYFGGNTKVYKADSGFSDAGVQIQGSAKTAFVYYGGRGTSKRFTAIRPIVSSDAQLPVSIGFDVDFNDGTSTYTPSSATTTGSEWDNTEWDVGLWAGTISSQLVWRSVADIGWNAAIRIKTSTQAQSIKWHSVDIYYEKGVGL
jgi:hypothetical protein